MIRTVRSLGLSGPRVLLTAVGVAVCVIIMSTAAGFVTWIERSHAVDLERFKETVFLQMPGVPFPPTGSRFHESVAGPALDMAWVDEGASSELLFLVLEPPTAPGESAAVLGVGLRPGRESIYLGIEPRTGLRNGSAGVIMGREAARHYGARPGDTVSIGAGQWSVISVLPRMGPASVDRAVLMPLDLAQSAFLSGGLVSALMLTPADHVTPRTLAARLDSEIGVLEAATYRTLADRARLSLLLPERFMWLAGLLAFLTAAVIVASSTMVSVVSRAVKLIQDQPSPGLPPARGHAVTRIMGESVLKAAAGGLPGIALTALLAHLLGWAFILSWRQSGTVVLLVLLVGLVGGLYPALQGTHILWRAARFGQLERRLREAFESRDDVVRAFHQQLAAREMERRRLARDLHDGILQSLLGLKMRAGQVGGQAAPLVEGVDDLIAELRGICRDLRPPALDQLGLGPAIRALSRAAAESSGVHIVFWEQGDPVALDEATAIALFRIAQEALANVARHSGADRAEVSVRWTASRVILIVSDNGRGFTPPPRLSTLTRGGQFGLAGMHERVGLVRGRLSIGTADLGGLRVMADVPLPETWNAGDHGLGHRA